MFQPGPVQRDTLLRIVSVTIPAKMFSITPLALLVSTVAMVSKCLSKKLNFGGPNEQLTIGTSHAKDHRLVAKKGFMKVSP